VDLDKPAAAIGIPVDRPSYLVFGFTRSSWLAGSRSTIHHATLLPPRSGHVYDIEASYLDESYRVRIRESASRNGGRRREMGQRRLSECVRR
jgi:hypothetical protein